MQKKAVLALLIKVIFMMFFVTYSNAIFNTDVKKAKDFIKAKMYPQAIELLNKRINEKPTDTQAHYLLGECYLLQSNYRKAEERFDSVKALDANYNSKIGDAYYRVGLNAQNEYQTDRAKSLYHKAVKFNPDLRNKISNGAFEQGKALFDSGQYNSSEKIFSIATAFNATLGQQISDMYFDAGNSADGKQSLALYNIAAKYSSFHNQEIGNNLVALAKEEGTSKADKKLYKKEASKYLSKAAMNKAFPPDYIDLIEEYTIVDLQDGKPSPKYYRLPRPGHSFYVGFNETSNHFYILTRGGRKITAKQITKRNFYFPEQEFKVVPTKKKRLKIMIQLLKD